MWSCPHRSGRARPRIRRAARAATRRQGPTGPQSACARLGSSARRLRFRQGLAQWSWRGAIVTAAPAAGFRGPGVRRMRVPWPGAAPGRLVGLLRVQVARFRVVLGQLGDMAGLEQRVMERIVPAFDDMRPGAIRQTDAVWRIVNGTRKPPFLDGRHLWPAPGAGGAEY